MPKLKKKITINYTIISNDVLHDEDLSGKDRGILATMISLPDDWDFSIAGLAKIMPDGESSIAKTLKKLEKMGYLRRTWTREKGKITDCVYELSDSRVQEWIDENQRKAKPYGENQDTVKQDVVNPVVENEGQLINKESNTEEVSNDLLMNPDSYDFIMTKLTRVEYEGMKMSDVQYKDICRLVDDAMNHKIDTCKGNIINYCKKLYKPETKQFCKPNGEEINSLYGYIKSTFNIKTERDKENEEAIKNEIAHELTMKEIYGYEC